MTHPTPPPTITPDHDAAKWFADTQLEFVHSLIANLARCYLELVDRAGRTSHGNPHFNPLD